MIWLGIESSCDETACAILQDDPVTNTPSMAVSFPKLPHAHTYKRFPR